MKLYVGNLPFSATEVDLERWFSDCGFAVDGVRLIRDRYSGESRGFGFVDIDDDEQAHSTIRPCNREDFMGRTLVVDQARRKPAPMGRAGSGSGYGRERTSAQL